MQHYTLESLPIGRSATIYEIDNRCSNKTRLLDLGFTKSTSITPLWQTRSRNIRAYRIKGTLIGLRTDEAQYINIIL